MTSGIRIDPRAYAMSAVGLATLAALFGTSVPIVREPETAIIRPFYAPTNSAVEAATNEAVTDPQSAPSLSTPELLAELRATTSFTWDQTSKLFGVSRRTVHLWAAGGNMTALNEEHLASLVREVRTIQTASSGDERMQMLALLDRERGLRASENSDINRPAPTYTADA